MITRILALALLVSTAGFSLPPVVAAEPAKVHPATPFPSGTSFFMKVTKVVSSKAGSGGFTPSGVRIPPGIPKYKVGDKIRFTIDDKGNLTWVDRKLPLYGDYDGFISYKKFPTDTKPYPDVANVYVNSLNKPKNAEIYFYKKKASGTVHTVLYEMK